MFKEQVAEKRAGLDEHVRSIVRYERATDSKAFSFVQFIL
jgi:hypothetical protein